MFSFKKLIKSFYHSFRGICYVFREEQNFRVQVFAAIFVVGLMFYFQIKVWEKIILILSIAMVLVLELVNTIIERLIDVFKPRIHQYVKDIKDIMAAAVLLSSLGAAIAGLLIFWPYFFQ